jgi:insertion element IS1 protein InsB
MAPSGSQKYKCKDCSYAFVEYPKNTHISEEKKTLVNRLLLEKLSLAGIARSVGVSEAWLQNYVNKKYKDISTTNIQRENSGLFLNAMRWDPFVGLHIGDRSHAGAKALWNCLPASSKKYSTIYTNFFESYVSIFPEKQYKALPIVFNL